MPLAAVTVPYLVTLVAKTDIIAHEKIYVDYGSEYFGGGVEEITEGAFPDDEDDSGGDEEHAPEAGSSAL